MKQYLQSYKQKEIAGYFTDGRTPYELDVLQVSFFGLIKRNKTIDYTLKWEDKHSTASQSGRATTFTEHWDNLIKTQKPLKDEFTWLQAIGMILVVIIIAPIIWIISKLIDALT